MQCWKQCNLLLLRQRRSEYLMGSLEFKPLSPYCRSSRNIITQATWYWSDFKALQWLLRRKWFSKFRILNNVVFATRFYLKDLTRNGTACQAISKLNRIYGKSICVWRKHPDAQGEKHWTCDIWGCCPCSHCSYARWIFLLLHLLQKFQFVIIWDIYSLLRVDYCIDFLGDVSVFPTTDTSWGHWQMFVTNEDWIKTILSSLAVNY